MPRARRKQPTRKRRFNLFLNPYQDVRFTRCPKCDGKTKLRKLPLVILIEPQFLLSLNKTCRYCPYCDLLIVHQDELEAQLAYACEQRDPSVIGNDYHVIGTADRSIWKQGMEGDVSIQDYLAQAYDFKKVLTFTLARGGWMPPEA
jgi:hypothetical protein